MPNPDTLSARASITGLLQSPDGAERVANLADSAAVLQRERPAVRDAPRFEQFAARSVEVGDGEVGDGAALRIAPRVRGVEEQLDVLRVHQLRVVVARLRTQ